jgi:hypothetical protein
MHNNHTDIIIGETFKIFAKFLGDEAYQITSRDYSAFFINIMNYSVSHDRIGHCTSSFISFSIHIKNTFNLQSANYVCEWLLL